MSKLRTNSGFFPFFSRNCVVFFFCCHCLVFLSICSTSFFASASLSGSTSCFSPSSRAAHDYSCPSSFPTTWLQRRENKRCISGEKTCKNDNGERRDRKKENQRFNGIAAFISLTSHSRVFASRSSWRSSSFPSSLYVLLSSSPASSSSSSPACSSSYNPCLSSRISVEAPEGKSTHPRSVFGPCSSFLSPRRLQQCRREERGGVLSASVGSREEAINNEGREERWRTGGGRSGAAKAGCSRERVTTTQSLLHDSIVPDFHRDAYAVLNRLRSGSRSSRQEGGEEEMPRRSDGDGRRLADRGPSGLRRRKVTVLGSTGSIGRQTLEVLEEQGGEDFEVVALAAGGRNLDLLADQILKFNPRVAAVSDRSKEAELRERVQTKRRAEDGRGGGSLSAAHSRGREETEIVAGEEGMKYAASYRGKDEELWTNSDRQPGGERRRDDHYHIAVNGIVGFAGLLPTISAIESGKVIALANKETLVAAAPLILPLLKKHNSFVIPVDSEHSALFQCLSASSSALHPLAGTQRDDPEEKEKEGEGEGDKRGGRRAACPRWRDVSRLILTASGGAFRDLKKEHLPFVSVEDATTHPNWSMGEKITIDSATLMNKGLEVLEAHYLFGIHYDNIDVVIHPQSIIHSMVEFTDSSVVAQLGLPDMKLPILYALSWPLRMQTLSNHHHHRSSGSFFSSLDSTSRTIGKPKSLLDENTLQPGRPHTAEGTGGGEQAKACWKRLDLQQIGKLTFSSPDVEKYPCLKLAYQAGKKAGLFPLILNSANECANQRFRNREIAFTDIPKVIENAMDTFEQRGGGETSGTVTLEEILHTDKLAREIANRQSAEDRRPSVKRK